MTVTPQETFRRRCYSLPTSPRAQQLHLAQAPHTTVWSHTIAISAFGAEGAREPLRSMPSQEVTQPQLFMPAFHGQSGPVKLSQCQYINVAGPFAVAAASLFLNVKHSTRDRPHLAWRGCFPQPGCSVHTSTKVIGLACSKRRS